MVALGSPQRTPLIYSLEDCTSSPPPLILLFLFLLPSSFLLLFTLSFYGLASVANSSVLTAREVTTFKKVWTR